MAQTFVEQQMEKAYRDMVMLYQQERIKRLQLEVEPAVLGTVLRVYDPPKSGIIDPTKKPFGTMMKVVAAKEQKFVGQKGFLLSNLTHSQEVTIGFLDEESTIQSFKLKNGEGKDEPVISLEEFFFKKAVVLVDNRQLECECPEGIDVQPGATVKLAQRTMQILEVISSVLVGDIAIIQQVLPENKCEISVRGSNRVVDCGRVLQLQSGDRVVLDVTNNIVVSNLGSRDARFSLSQKFSVPWSAIGGQDSAIQEIRSSIELIYRNPKLAKAYDPKAVKGLLLMGPPGNGKTTLGKAVATFLAELYSVESVASGFIYVKGPEILEPLVGNSEATIRSLYARARAHHAKFHYPAVIFVDEADAVTKKRGSGISSDTSDYLVPAWTNEMDGMDINCAITIMASNRPDTMDPAITRDGRLDTKIWVPRPDREGSVAIFKIHLAGKPLAKGETIEELATFAAQMLFDQKYAMYEIEVLTKKGEQTVKEKMHFCLQHISSGAMIANIVNKAVFRAMERDGSAEQASGISRGDVTAAIDAVFAQNEKMSHADAITEFTQDVKGEIVSAEKLYTKHS